MNSLDPRTLPEVRVPAGELRSMVRTARAIHRLSLLPDYRELVGKLQPEPTARFDPGHDAVMMGLDFHLTPEGPRLIEVNTNAGGGLLALAAYRGPEAVVPERLRQRLHASFAAEWRRFGGRGAFPKRVVILDERPGEQFLYPEMQAFARLFREWGAEAAIADPGELAAEGETLLWGGEPVEMIYNRHCDFYLEGPEVEVVKRAYLAGSVCLTPNPFTYALLADKRRFLLWCRPEFGKDVGLSPRQGALLEEVVPETRLLAEVDVGDLWREREAWVFKPVTGFGSRGVVLGKGISRARLAVLDPQRTLIQRLVPPPRTAEGLKIDLRLFAYRQRMLGVSARVYRGQVTNMRGPDSGFTRVRLA